MKIFISWSGKLSQNLGNALKEWIPDVLQAVQCYFTPEDIQKGDRWSSEIAKELEESMFGIFCVTPENLRGCPACFLILKGVVISSHETNRFS